MAFLRQILLTMVRVMKARLTLQATPEAEKKDKIKRARLVYDSTVAGAVVTNVHITKEIVALHIHDLPHNLLVLV